MSSTVCKTTLTVGETSRRTSSLAGRYCHGTGITGEYLEIRWRRHGEGVEGIVSQRGGDVGRRSHGVSRWREGCCMIRSDKEVETGVATSGNVRWLFWYGVVLMVCKIMRWYSGVTSEYETSFQCCRWIVYNEMIDWYCWISFPYLFTRFLV